MSNLPWRWIINKKDGTPLLSLKTKEEAKCYMNSDLYDVFPVYKGDPEAYNNRGKVIAIRPNGQPDVTSSMKASCIGEFHIKVEEVCTSCNEHTCDVCFGEGYISREVVIPWDTCKDIFKAMVLESPNFGE